MSDLTQPEQTALVRLARRKARQAADTIRQAAADREVELLRQLDLQFSLEDMHVQEMADELSRVAEEANRRIQARCDELGIISSARPKLAIGYYAGGVRRRADREDLRNQLKAENKAAVAAAVTKANAWALEVEEALLLATSGEAAHAVVGEMPTIAELLPAADPQTVLSVMGAQPERMAAERRSAGKPAEVTTGVEETRRALEETTG